MSYLDELRTLEEDGIFSEMPKSASVESVETLSKQGLDTLDTASPGPFQKKSGFTLEATPAEDIANPPGWLEARLERAAILEYEAGLNREEAEREAARLHPESEPCLSVWRVLTPEHDSHVVYPAPVDADTVRADYPEAELVEPVSNPPPPEWREPDLSGFAMADLQAAAHADEWDAIKGDPGSLEVFARSLLERRQMDACVVPDRFTKLARCKGCGAVWVPATWPTDRRKTRLGQYAVETWDEAESCPWCRLRVHGKRYPRVCPADDKGRPMPRPITWQGREERLLNAPTTYNERNRRSFQGPTYS